MPALVAAPRPSIAVDLAIHEFDQWSYSGHLSIPPCGSCWYDVESDLAED